MAAPYVTAVRTALKGVHRVPGRWLLTQRNQTPAVCQSLRLHAAQRRPLHVTAAASQCSSRAEPRSSTQPRRAEEEEEEEEEYDGPEYIPKKKAKNPMVKIGYAWMIGMPMAIIGFLLVKREVDKNRLKQLKIRQRMNQSNVGEYERSRYHHHTVDVKQDQ